MADKLYFSRDTRVVVRLTGQDHAFEIPVLDGYAFSQATNSSEITLNEMADSDGNSRRARQMFNDSYSPAEWSFSTYAQPLHQVGTGQSAVEAPLWALLAGKATYTDGAGTNAVWQDGANTYGQEVTETAVNKWKLDFTQSNKSALGTADIYFVMGSANSPASATDMAVYKVEGCCVNEAGFDFDMEGLTTISWSGLGKLVSQITPGHGTTPDDGDSEIWYKSDDASLYFKGASAHVAVNKYESDNFIRNRLTQLTIGDNDSRSLEALRNVLTEVGSLGMDTGSAVWSSPYSTTVTAGGVSHSNLIADADIAAMNFDTVEKYQTAKVTQTGTAGTVTNLLKASIADAVTDQAANPYAAPTSGDVDIDEDFYGPAPDYLSGHSSNTYPEYFRTDHASTAASKHRLYALNLGYNNDAAMASGNPIAGGTQVTVSAWFRVPKTSEEVKEVVFFMGDPSGSAGTGLSYNNVVGVIADLSSGVPTLKTWNPTDTTRGTGSTNVTNAAIETNKGWFRLSYTANMVAGSTGYQLGSTGDQHLGVAFMSKKADGTFATFDTTTADVRAQSYYTHTTSQEQGILVGGWQIEAGSTLTPYHQNTDSYLPKLTDIAVTANQTAFPALVETFLGGTTSAERLYYSNTNGGVTSGNPSIQLNFYELAGNPAHTATNSANHHTVSAYVKRTHADVRYCMFKFMETTDNADINAGSGAKGLVLDFDDGSLESGWNRHQTGSAVSDEGNGWYRISFPLPATTQTIGSLFSDDDQILDLSFSGSTGFSASSDTLSSNPSTFGETKGIFFGGVQLETGGTLTTLNSSTSNVGAGSSTTTRLVVTTNQSALPSTVETLTGLTSSADKITLGGAGNHDGRYMITADLDSATSGSPSGSHTFSAYVKRTDSSVRYVSMQVFDTSSTGDVTAINSPAGVVYNFDTTSFATVSAFSGQSNTAYVADSGWTRISFTANVPSGSNPRLGFSFAGVTGLTGGNVAPLETKHSEVAGHGIEVGAIQMEAGGTLTAYQNQNNRPVDPNSTAKAFGLTLTGGNITINNNMTFLTPETMGAVDVPLGHVTGTRSISGSFTCYLNSEDDSSAELFKDIIDGRLTTNDFDLGFGIGNGGTGNDVPRIEIDLDHCHLELPTHNIEDVVSLETNFHALPTSVDDKDELTIKYVSSEA